MSAKSTEILLKASKEGDINSAREILEKNKIDVNCKDILIQNIHDIQNLIFFHDIPFHHHFWDSIYTFNRTPLIHASSEGHLEIVQLLLSNPNIEINCKTILI